ncbi:MAG: DUF58 domain-containing protein [Sphingomonadaceae bacterium]|nr:DUF58 domain-containing protein [Sphingomonadaceae bacterium]
MAAGRAWIVPTGRAALVAAGLAPVALLVAATAPGLWVVAPVLALIVLALVLLDAVLAGSGGEVGLTLPGDTEVGAAGEIAARLPAARGWPHRIEAALEGDPRLFPGGRATLALAQAENGWEGAAQFVPSRRGTGLVERLWLRWTGPLGLGARQREVPIDRAVRVWPNVAPVRSPTLQTFLKDAQFGLVARRIRGEGTQFEALADYEPGMDRRRIDWKASARHARLYAKEFEAERNNQIVFAFDCGQAMCEPVGGPAGSAEAGLTRLDRAITAALTAAYVALKGGDKIALYGFAARPQLLTPFITDSRAFRRLQQAAAGLEYQPQEPNFTLALATLASQLQRRSMVVVFSDFTDPTSAELMIESIGRLTSRHLVLFVTLADAELDSMATAAPQDEQALAMAVGADALLRQRALVLSRLRALGVDVIEAPHDRIGMRLIDAYLAIKARGAIG